MASRDLHHGPRRLRIGGGSLTRDPDSQGGRELDWGWGVVTLAAVWLGNALSRGKDERHWRRDRSLEAFSDLMRASETITASGDSAPNMINLRT
jgi:hypothetical protein